jgi:cytochrome c553
MEKRGFTEFVGPESLERRVAFEKLSEAQITDLAAWMKKQALPLITDQEDRDALAEEYMQEWKRVHGK